MPSISLVSQHCHELIGELVAQAGEARSVDYKARMAFPKRADDAWAELMKDLLSFANGKDGGYIVIGADNNSKRPDGMTLEQAASWDITVVSDAVKSVGAPPPDISVCQTALPDGHVVAIRIAEFPDLPHVCTAGVTSKKTGRPILRQGALYIRTPAATSQEIDSERLMREFLARAYLRSGEGLLRQIKALIDAHWPGDQPSAEALYSDQIKRDFEEMGWP